MITFIDFYSAGAEMSFPFFCVEELCLFFWKPKNKNLKPESREKKKEEKASQKETIITTYCGQCRVVFPIY